MVIKSDSRPPVRNMSLFKIYCKLRIRKQNAQRANTEFKSFKQYYFLIHDFKNFHLSYSSDSVLYTANTQKSIGKP